MVISKGLRQAYDMQDFAYNAAMALREQLTQDGKVCAPSDKQAQMIGVLNKSWKDAQEQIRIHKGKPLPGSLTHEKVRAPRTRKREALSALAQSVEHAPTQLESAQGAP